MPRRIHSLPACEDKKRFIGITVFWLNAFIFALLVRLPWVHFISWDYTLAFGTWYEFIVDNGYFLALKYDFSNYNVLYLYLLTLAAFSLPSLTGTLIVKVLPMVFDFILAFFVYKCVRLKYSQSETAPHLAALVTLLAPTVVLNGAIWGQNDSIYTTFLVACLYGLLSGRQVWAFIAFGISFSFKLQALFLAPLFLWLLTKKRVNWRYFFLSPLVYFVTLIPAWIIGRPLEELILIYLNQADQNKRLTKNAINLYQWIPNHYIDWYPIGVVFAASVVAIIAVFVYKSRVEVTEDLVIYMATCSVLIMPFILPKMHDRFFFPADIIAIVLAFYLPRYWYTPVIIGMTSLLAYFPFLYGVTFIPLAWLAFFPLALIAVLGWKLLQTLGHLPPSRARVNRLQRSARTHRRPPR